ncbi:MAG TPA: discoidin domain-containing protein [Syntrophomonadaceae bacterium]|nr:discoidin domain-containing protein [Syntrophomonadaceae bacterium]
MKNLKITSLLSIMFCAGLLFMLVCSCAAIGTASAESLVNVAQGKNATQSSDGWGGIASSAVDGNTDGNFWAGSVSHTNYDSFGPWLQVDLGESYSIDHISIWNRTDGSTDRLKNFYVFVSNNPFSTNSFADLAGRSDVFTYYHQGTIGTTLDIPVNCSGRYVRVQIDHQEWLHLAEVQVWSSGTPSGEGGGGESFPILSAIPSYFELFQ